MRYISMLAAAAAVSAVVNGTAGPAIADTTKAKPLSPREQMLQRYGQSSVTSYIRHFAEASKNAASTLAWFVLNPDPSGYSTQNVTDIQRLVNQARCPIGYDCPTPELKIPVDGMIGPKTAFGTLDVLTRTYGGGFYTIKPAQLAFFQEHLGGHPQEAEITQRLNTLYTQALKYQTSKTLAQTKARGTRPDGKIGYGPAGHRLYAAYVEAKKDIESRQRQPEVPPAISFLHRTSTGTFPSADSINREAAITALKAVNPVFANLVSFDDRKALPENAAIINSFISDGIDRIREYEAASEFNQRLDMDEACDQGKCTEARLDDGAPKQRHG